MGFMIGYLWARIRKAANVSIRRWICKNAKKMEPRLLFPNHWFCPICGKCIISKEDAVADRAYICDRCGEILKP